MGVNRKFARSSLKIQYENFKKLWRQEKENQEKLPEEKRRSMGRAPTFKQWKTSAEKMKKQLTENFLKKQQEEDQKLEDLSWEEILAGSPEQPPLVQLAD